MINTRFGIVKRGDVIDVDYGADEHVAGEVVETYLATIIVSREDGDRVVVRGWQRIDWIGR